MHFHVTGGNVVVGSLSMYSLRLVLISSNVNLGCNMMELFGFKPKGRN